MQIVQGPTDKVPECETRKAIMALKLRKVVVVPDVMTRYV